MKKRKNYASKLTKEDLIKGGITLITEDGLIFKGEEQATFSVTEGGYLTIWIYELDENGERIKKPITRTYRGCSKPVETYVYEARTVGLHRAMWAWFHGEVPEGYVVDHINNKHDSIEDYHLSNLQLLTPAENLMKERGNSTKQIPCSLKRPLSFYENKLNAYLAEYEEAKKNHEADRAHHLRANIANTRARIRYYIAHKEEAEKIEMERVEEEARKEAYHARAEKIRELDSIVTEKRYKYWDARSEYGEDHFVTECYKAEWHTAVKERDDYIKFSE